MNDKCQLQQILAAGIYGDPELKREERLRYLGEFRERVLKALTFDQIAEPGTYPEIEEALKDKRARKLVVSQKAKLDEAREYIRLARACGLQFTMVNNPDLRGDIGLVVVSDDAVDEPCIFV
jgi:uncharacterized protein YueI